MRTMTPSHNCVVADSTARFRQFFKLGWQKNKRNNRYYRATHTAHSLIGGMMQEQQRGEPQ